MNLPCRSPLAEQPTAGRRNWRWAVWLAGSLAIGWLFGSSLLGWEALAFRDVWHFYQPLYGWLGQWWPWGVPRWNPLDQTGLPTFGEATSANLYPPRWIFASGLPAHIAMSAYVVLHLLLAAVGCYRLVREQGAGATAAVYAGWAYAASGCVFFLYTNPPFLVGASWLPWIVRGLLSAALHRGWRHILGAAVCLAAAILGGDPQSAVHGVLVASGLWICGGGTLRPVEGAEVSPATVGGQSRGAAKIGSGLARILVAGGFAAMLAAPQVMAGWHWASRSFRTETASPHAVEVLFAGFGGDDRHAGAKLRRLFQRPAPDTHAADVYDFSISPWHAAQFVLPTVSGQLAGRNQRWMDALPGEGRIWTPTMYCGLVASVFWLCGLLERGAKGPWWWLALLAWLLALGRFGLGYVVRTFWFWWSGEAHLGLADAVGGPYWWLVTLLPGYGGFRYPAKWLPLVALGLVVHAALFGSASDAAWSGRRQRICTGVCGGVIVVALFAAMVTLLPVVGRWFEQLSQRADLADRFWGPVDADGARAAIWIAALQACLGAAVVCGAVWSRRRGAGALLLLTVVEMTWLAHWQLHRVPAVVAVGSARPTSVVPARLHGRTACPPGLLLVEREMDWPRRWVKTTAESGRLAEVMEAQRGTYFGRWHLADGVRVVNHGVSIESVESELFWREYHRRTAATEGSQRAAANRLRNAVADLLGVREWMNRRSPAERRDALRDESVVNRSAATGAVRFSESFQIVERPGSMTELRHWVSRWFDQMAGGISNEPVVWRLADTAEHLAWVRAHAGRFDADVGGTETESEPRLQVVSCAPERVALELFAPRAGLVRLMRFQDGHWRATLRGDGDAAAWRQVPVHRTDLLGQGVFVPAGAWQLRFEYAPPWWWPSVLVAAAAWFAVLATLARGTVARIRR